MTNKIILIYFSLLLVGQIAFGQTNPVETVEITSKVFNGTRKIKVVLPAEYAEYPNRKYKVIRKEQII